MEIKKIEIERKYKDIPVHDDDGQFLYWKQEEIKTLERGRKKENNGRKKSIKL